MPARRWLVPSGKKETSKWWPCNVIDVQLFIPRPWSMHPHWRRPVRLDWSVQRLYRDPWGLDSSISSCNRMCHSSLNRRCNSGPAKRSFPPTKHCLDRTSISTTTWKFQFRSMTVMWIWVGRGMGSLQVVKWLPHLVPPHTPNPLNGVDRQLQLVSRLTAFWLRTTFDSNYEPAAEVKSPGYVINAILTWIQTRVSHRCPRSWYVLTPRLREFLTASRWSWQKLPHRSICAECVDWKLWSDHRRFLSKASGGRRT